MSLGRVNGCSCGRVVMQGKALSKEVAGGQEETFQFLCEVKLY